MTRNTILASKTLPGVLWVPRHLLRQQTAKAKTRAAMRHAARAREDRAPDPPNLAHRLRKASGRPVETIEERMLANAQKAHAKRKPKALTSKGTAPAPPDLATYVRAKRRGLGNAEAMAEAEARR